MNSDPWSIQPFIGPIIIIISLIAVHGILSAAEIAIVSINPNKMIERSLEGNKKANRVLKILDQADAFLTTIQVGLMLSSLLISGAAIYFVSLIFTAANFPFTENLASAALFSSMIMTPVVILLGDKLPKAIAAQNPDHTAMALSSMVYILRTVTRPVVWLMDLGLRGLKRLLPIEFNTNEEAITRDEFRSFLEHSHQHEVIDIDEFSMLKGVLSLDNKIAREVMVPRTDAFMLDYDDPNEENIQEMLETPHSRVPLYFEDKDNILGIVHVKNLLKESKNQPLYSIDLKSISNEPLFVPETIYIDDLIFQMKRTQNQMAILNDEYGGVVGIVTLEDLLEEIVGEIDDEYDESNNLIEEIDEIHYSVDGATPLDEFNEFFDTTIDSEDVDTIAGYFITEYGSIPDEEEDAYIEAQQLRLTVDKMEGSRISSLIIEKLNEIEDAQHSNGAEEES
ncbi:hemolysin family protein [Alkalibacterium pelagium]|jgi:putative hemolysin|uniref:Putative hemolysin n=1 Tax=Alkalibacterium pelagium TaxID=426702 RepID=A0A1H7FBI2_9LACT|nr:hemolysin family protein [Alkalibacterium pelagium]GEN49457.1 hemolysin [Alkalibacterium pelagium]SEK21742.1 putative hemolysin [Alkalibacterium pelagium]